MTANERRPIVPGQRNVAHVPAPPLDPLSEQIHRRYRERQDDLKARYARIAPSPATTDAAPATPPPVPSPPAPANPAPAATLSAADEAEEAWLALLVAEYRASSTAGEDS